MNWRTPDTQPRPASLPVIIIQTDAYSVATATRGGNGEVALTWS